MEVIAVSAITVSDIFGVIAGHLAPQASNGVLLAILEPNSKGIDGPFRFQGLNNLFQALREA